MDPVGVSGSTFRRERLLTWMEELHPTCVRGNYSEIRSMIDNCRTTTGVDAAACEHTEEGRKRLMREMRQYALEQQTILIASGETDILTDGCEILLCENGDPQMTRITGSGCMSSALLGAFLSEDPSLAGAAACCAFVGIAGEIAAQQTLAQGGGTMTFHDRLIDAVSLMNKEKLQRISYDFCGCT
jgi:hydroxyethylthiazole kinase